VVLAVVDPGVGSARRAVAVEVGGGSTILVGPDNGLLAPTVALVGGATAAADITNSPFRLEAPGPTFDGRDLFAPVAAQLCLGVPLAEVGTPLDPAKLMPAVMPVSNTEGDVIVAEVLWVDRFGNCQLNVDPDELTAGSYSVQIGQQRRPDRGRGQSIVSCERAAAQRGSRGALASWRRPRGRDDPCLDRPTLMRKATVITIAILMLLIVGAAFYQIVILGA